MNRILQILLVLNFGLGAYYYSLSSSVEVNKAYLEEQNSKLEKLQSNDEQKSPSHENVAAAEGDALEKEGLLGDEPKTNHAQSSSQSSYQTQSKKQSESEYSSIPCSWCGHNTIRNGHTWLHSGDESCHESWNYPNGIGESYCSQSCCESGRQAYISSHSNN